MSEEKLESKDRNYLINKFNNYTYNLILTNVNFADVGSPCLKKCIRL